MLFFAQTFFCPKFIKLLVGHCPLLPAGDNATGYKQGKGSRSDRDF
jgi:hypothetical protein